MGYARFCKPKSNNRGYSDDDDTGSPNSDSTVLAPRGFGTASRIDLGPRSGEILRHPKMDYKDAPSTHYLSPSSLNSPVTARLEAFSPMLSPVRENKSVEESWRNDSFYLAPLPQTQENNFDFYKEPISQLSPPSQKMSLVCIPGSPGIIGQKNNLSLSSFTSQNPLLGSRGGNSRDKVVPPFAANPSPSPVKKRGFVETLKGRSKSGPINLVGGSRGLRMAPLRTLRVSSVGAILGRSSPGRRYVAPKLDTARGNFQSLESRTPTPTGRIADDVVVRERHRGLETAMRSSYFSAEALMAAASEPSVITVTQTDPSTPPNKATTRNCQTPGMVQPPCCDGFDSSPERRNSRLSITPGLLSTPERGDEFLIGGNICRERTFGRENSAVSTVFSATTNNTGDIPSLAVEIASISSTRRVLGVPKLIDVARNVSGGSTAVLADECYGMFGTIVDVGTVNAVCSVKSVDVTGKESTEMCPLARSGIGKRIDVTTKRAGSHGSTSKLPCAKSYPKRNSSYGNDPKAREAIRKDTKEYLNSAQKRLGRDMELGGSGVGEVPDATVVSTSPKMVSIGAGQKPTNGKLFIGQQRNTTGGHAGTPSFRKSHQRISGGGFTTSNTGYRIRRGSTAGAAEKSYMRPLAKNAPSPLHRNYSSGTLSTISNKSSTRAGGQNFGNKDAEQAFIDRKSGKSVDPLKKQEMVSAVGFENGSKTSIAAAIEIDALEELAREKMPGIIAHTVDSLAGVKNLPKGGVLVDITSIGCSSNPRTIPVSGRWFGRRETGIPIIPRPAMISGLVEDDTQKENHRPHTGGEQCLQPQGVTPKLRALGNLTNWLSSGRKSKGKSASPPPNGRFSPEEVESLIKRLSTQIPQTPDQKNGFRVLGGRYYSLNIPNLDKSPSKDEKDRNPIAVCMDLINTASNEPQSFRRENLLQMSRIMVDIVSKSRDAECAAEEAKLAARRAEVAFLETRKHLAEMTELVKHKKREI